MSAYNNPKLITPPKEEDEISPYFPIWGSVAVQVSVLVGVAVALYVAAAFLGLRFPSELSLPVNIGLACLPLLLWFVSAPLRERSALEPRQQLIPVVILSALLANAIGIPLLRDTLQPESWLSLSSASNRIIGYTITYGLVQEFLKYLVLRYLVWPRSFRVRDDAIAYGIASAVGYALMLNLDYVFSNAVAPDVAILRILSLTGLNLVGSMIMAYGLYETSKSHPPLYILPISLFLAALLHGFAIPLRSGFVNAGLALTISTTRPIIGLGFTIAAIVGAALFMWFTFTVSERRERDLQRSED